MKDADVTPGAWRPPGRDDAAGLALFLDLDGTLIDIAATPAGAFAPPGLCGLLQHLSQALGGALAIVSGRPIAEIDRLLAPARLRAAGVHGAEIRDELSGAVRRVAPPLSEDFVASVEALADRHPGVVVEPKSAAIAVHFRQAPMQAEEIERRLRALMPDGDDTLDLRPGRKVAEIVRTRVSKGAAVQDFMQRAPFPGRLPVMIGDDFTDLSAFAAAESFGGRGLRVAGEFFDAQASDFGGTAEVRNWLLELSERLAAIRPGDGS